MKKLFAVSFDKYSNANVQDGTVYNIVDSRCKVYLQVCVGSFKEAPHHLLMDTIKGVRSDIRYKVADILDKRFGVDSWEISALFNRKVSRDNPRFKELTWMKGGKKVKIDVESDQVKLYKIQTSQQKGLY